MFVVQSAITLLATPNSQYTGRSLTDVIDVVMTELGCLNHFFDDESDEPEGTIH